MESPNTDEHALSLLADDVLTYIEQREAEQIAYGVYNVTMTGAELIADYRAVNAALPPLDDREKVLAAVLSYLANERLIICFGNAVDPADWVFRSRVAEMVRLLSRLRQRLPPRDNNALRQQISHGKRLTGDVTFHVTPRRVPRRHRLLEAYLAILSGSTERERCAALLRQVITEYLPKLRAISQFQEDALGEILRIVELSQARGASRGVVVTAGTGAGKTYAFFLPMLAKMILERSLRGRLGVKAICIYPRVALSENQLRDFIEAVFRVNQVLIAHKLPPLTLGIESGAAVYRLRELQRTDDRGRRSLSRRGWRYDERFGGYLAPFAYCVGVDGYSCASGAHQLGVRPSDPRTLRCPACGTSYPFIQFARDEMARVPPDLLVATTESLNRRLVSSDHQYLFGTHRFCAPSVVMLDEIHLQTSTAGTQVALLMRRLLARIQLGKRERGEMSNLAFVGLSATIAGPREFLAELSGIPVQNISEVKPHEEELEIIGAERYIFVRAEDSEDTAVISTLIQTAMCVLHTMPQPTANSDVNRFRAFGFVQSLDVVGRWLYQMRDAEKMQEWFKQERGRLRASGTPVEMWPLRVIPLYVYRFPPFNRQLFPNLFGLHQNQNCDCERGQPDQACPFFAAGECWWVLSQRGKARREPLNITRKSGADRDTPIQSDDDLIITTSALEVGYDDEALMCVIQYTAPSNVASFVQRKGRGGRKVGTRPIVVTVLSPYKLTDLFLFRNQHLLTEPAFRKLPLNAQNRYLQRIHGFYALFDWIAYRAHVAGNSLSLDELNVQGLAYLMEQTADADVLLAFKDYLRQTFVMDAESLSLVLTEETQGLLIAILAEGLVQQAYPRLASAGARPINPRDLLCRYLPDNLFSDINLPEVRVDYHPDRQHSKLLSAESVSLAISETIPGNVTFRGGKGAVWVPPIMIDGSNLVALEDYYTGEELRDRASTARLPRRSLRLLGIKPQRTRELPVIRPEMIKPVPFSADHERVYWYVDSERGVLREHRGYRGELQDVKQLAHSTSAFPLGAVVVRAVRERPPRDYSLSRSHPAIVADPLAQALVERIVLHSDEPANQNLLQVQRLFLGSQYTLKSHDPGFDQISGVLGFCRNAANPSPVSLGFEMLTEGLVLDVCPGALDDFIPSARLARQIRTNAIAHRFVTDMTVEEGTSYFAAVNLANVLLTIVDLRLQGDADRLDDVRTWLYADNSELFLEAERIAREVHGLSPKNTAAVTHLLQDAHLRRFLDICSAAEPGGQVFQHYLRDAFQYSLAIALRQVVQEIAGVEALNYVSAWTELYVDYGSPADSIWLYEIGMGGIGVMRAAHEVLRRDPERFWADLGQKMTRCPTAQQEAFLRLLLAQPEDWLAGCDTLVADITGSRSADERQQAIDELLAAVRRQLQVPVAPTVIKALLRVFVPEYVQTVDGLPIVNWRLYREINQQFLPRCALEFGREPSITEARAWLARAVLVVLPADEPHPYPELHRLARAYRTELDAGQGEDELGRETRAALENAIERRLLITCRGACPTCIDDRSGEIETPGLARLILSRNLLDEWTAFVRSAQTVRIGMGGALAEVSQQLRQIFEHGARVAYLRAPPSQLAALCAVVSYLTDAGIDTVIGMRYPLVSEVRTVYPDEPGQPAQVELALRLIE